MPFAYRIDPDARLGAVAFYGDVTGADLVAAMEALFGDEAWEPGFSALWDGRGIERLTLGFTDYSSVLAAAVRLLGRIGGGTGVVLTSGFEEYASAFQIRKHLGPVPGRQLRLAGGLREALALLEVRELPETIGALLDEHLPEL